MRKLIRENNWTCQAITLTQLLYLFCMQEVITSNMAPPLLGTSRQILICVNYQLPCTVKSRL